MALTLAIPKATPPERRVALTPQNIEQLPLNVVMTRAAGEGAFFNDASYQGVTLNKSNQEVLAKADIIFTVEPLTVDDIKRCKPSAVVIGLLSPWQHSHSVAAMAQNQLTSFSLELLPRITRAQAMDVLSSQATATGYQAALIAAQQSSQFFPMLTTAAGSIRPAKVLVVGAGVAGLQAIATAKRLGAIVTAYDIRPEAKEQVESLGAKLLQVDVEATAQGGYARELTEAEQQQQQQLLTKAVADVDVIITTAAIPGKEAPLIITKSMVESMQPGSVIVDLAAETGGNCELTKVGQIYCYQNVTLCGPTHLSSELAHDASVMLAKNFVNFCLLLLDDQGNMNLDWQDEIIQQTALTHQGEIISSRVNVS